MCSAQLVYAAVYRGATMLSNYISQTGSNYNHHYQNMFMNQKITTPVFYQVESGITFSVKHTNDDLNFFIVINNRYPAEICQKILDDVHSSFITQHGLDWKSAEQDQYQNSFYPTFLNLERNVKLNQIEQNVNDTISQSRDNIVSAGLRGRKLEDFQPTAELLRESSSEYHRNSKALKYKLCWQKYSHYVFFSIIGIIVIFCILVIACGGFDFRPRCRAEKK